MEHAEPHDDDAATALDAAAFDGLMAALGPFERPPRLAVAVSGGADSLALSLLADAWARSYGGSVLALTVDHGLRPEAAEEAARVHGWLTARGIEHHTMIWPGGMSAGRDGAGNIQARARDARYRLLLDRCRAEGIVHLLLGHHRDDQAETVLMRLGRGSGLYGLSGMAPIAEQPEARLLRPLLPVPRAALEATCRAFDQPWIDDPSNDDARHARVRLRGLLPALAAEGLTGARLAETAARLGRARAASEEAVAILLAEAVTVHPLGFATLHPAPFAEAPEETGLRALARVLACIGGHAFTPRLEGLERALAVLGAEDLTLAGCRIVRRRGGWLVCREAGRAARPVPFAAGAWDDRWTWTAERALPGLEVGVLGEADLGQVPEEARKPLPAVVVEPMPALRATGRVVAVPSLGWSAPDPGLPEMRSLAFAPRVALTYGDRGGLRRVRRHLSKQV